MTYKRWFSVALFNLMILAGIGLLLRCKIVFPIEFIDQKHLLHGHSHFAFSGWVSQALMTLIIASVYNKTSEYPRPVFRRILLFNLIASYGMLITFIIQGYGPFSIFFSTASIFISYFFAIRIWKDLPTDKEQKTRNFLFRSALVFNAISSIGAFALATMMATHTIHQNWYLASVYFFLHFQYNGWFMMTCFGLFFCLLENWKLQSAGNHRIAQLMVLSCIPAYFLSTLWMDLPVWLYAIIVAAAFTQMTAWFVLLKSCYRNRTAIRSNISFEVYVILMLVAVAMSIKLILQLGSTIPSLADWAFGFRPIVIGYLHLVLLGIISLFIIAMGLQQNFILNSHKTISGIMLFIGGIFLNEILLMTQGVAAISMMLIPFVNELLLIPALVMLLGIIRILITNKPLVLPEKTF